MEARLKKGHNQIMKEIMELKTEKSWAQENKKIKEQLEITEEDIYESTYKLKTKIKTKMNLMFHKKLNDAAQNKLKMQYYMEGKQKWEPGKRIEYINKLTRNQASTIFKARTRMLQVKDNYRNGHTNITCRACKKENETQEHALNGCINLHPKEESKIKYGDIFSKDTDTLRKISHKISETMMKLENY